MKIILALLALVGSCLAGAHFNYATKNSWPSEFPKCGGQAQSPINLAGATCSAGLAVPATNFGTFNGQLLNNGHAIEVAAPAGAGSVTIEGKTFDLLQFHFHWGLSNNLGSEHQIDGSPFSMEMHIVTKAADNTLAVLGFFFRPGAVNSALKVVTDNLGGVAAVGSQVGISGVNVADLIAPALRGKFFRYAGSLTTPGCDEIVTWTSFASPLDVSGGQLQAFRATAVGGNNFRDVQALNGRPITAGNC